MKHNDSKSALYQYAKLRCAIARLESKLKSLEPLAIDEAFEIAVAKTEKLKGRSGGRVVYEDPFIKMVLVLRTKYLSDQEDEVLANLDCRIRKAQTELAQRFTAELTNLQSQIDALSEAIANLEAEREKLFQTPEIQILKKSYENRREKTCYQVPGISASVSALASINLNSAKKAEK